MAAIPVAELSDEEKGDLVCTYAALILHDDDIPITAENIQKLVAASGNAVEPYLPVLFAKAVGGADVKALLSSAGSASGGAPAAAAAPAAASAGGGGEGGGDKAAPKKEEKKEEEEEDEDMGFSLFD